MNLSFFICAVAVDISNILGQGVRGIIASAIDALPSVPEIKEAGGNADLQSGSTWGQKVGFLATALVALGVGAATGTLGVILVALASIATFVFTAFVMLALRNVLLALTIIVAPLAFVAMILPGTNGLFTKWRKLFTGLLILFPLIMLLLYGGMLISHIILFTYDPNAGDLERIFVVIIAAIAATAGVIAMPTAFNALLGVVGKVTAGRLNNPNKGLVDRAKKKSGEMRGNSRWAGAMNYRKAMREYNAGMRRGRTPTRVNNLLGGKGYADSARRRAAGLEQKEDMDAVNDARAQQAHMTNAELAKIASGQQRSFIDSNGKERKVNNYGRVAAAQKVLETGNLAERETIYDSVQGKDKLGEKEFKEQELFRKQVSETFFKKGDTAYMHPAYGGELLTGTSNGSQGRLDAVARSINAGRITAAAMVHDAQGTEDVLTVLAGKKYVYDDKGNIKRNADGSAQVVDHTYSYEINQGHIDNMAKVAQTTLTNEETAQKATAPTFRTKLEAITRMDSGTRGATTGVSGAPQTVSAGASQPITIQQNVTRGMTPSDVAQLSPQQVQMSVQNGGGAANLNQADLNTIYSAMNQSGKDYGDLSRQIQQAMDRASAANSPAAPPPIPASQQTTQTDASGRQTPGSVNDPDEYRRRFGG